MKTLKEQLTAAQREVEIRRRVYPGWVTNRKMTQAKMEHEVECMEAIVATIQRLIVLEEVSDEMLGRKSEQVEII